MGRSLEDKKIALNMANRAATGAMSRKMPPAYTPGDPQAQNRHVNLAIDALDNAKEARYSVKMHALAQARDRLNKETERGAHRPAVGGYTNHKHGGES